MNRSITKVRRTFAAAGAALLILVLSAAPALACGGLIGPNGAVNLLRTTTLAGYHDGVEHYVTAFQFAGGGGAFGSLTPLPGIPSSVEKGGDWTLQRLIQETEPQLLRSSARAAADARRLRRGAHEGPHRRPRRDRPARRSGRGRQVGHGPRLPAPAGRARGPRVLRRASPIFLAAVFDADAAAERGQAVGDGTPVHITIPTDNPWVPLRILGLGKAAAGTRRRRRLPADRPDARPLLPAPTGANGLVLDHSAPASDSLLDDLRSDTGHGMGARRRPG